MRIGDPLDIDSVVGPYKDAGDEVKQSQIASRERWVPPVFRGAFTIFKRATAKVRLRAFELPEKPMDRLPLIAPRPPRLSERAGALRAIEERGVYSNGGPVVRGFEVDLRDRVFGGAGDCLAVGNATLGLMLAIRHAAGVMIGSSARMPSGRLSRAAPRSARSAIIVPSTVVPAAVSRARKSVFQATPQRTPPNGPG